MVHKILISILAAAEVLTLFPLLFFGIYSLISSGDIAQQGTASMTGTMAIALFYAASVLFGAYQAITNFNRPKVAYLFLVIPLIVAGVVYYFVR